MQNMVYVGSITHAMRAKRLLEQHGIAGYIRQTTHKTGGCGYYVMIPSYSSKTAALLRANGFTVSNGKERAAP